MLLFTPIKFLVSKARAGCASITERKHERSRKEQREAEVGGGPGRIYFGRGRVCLRPSDVSGQAQGVVYTKESPVFATSSSPGYNLLAKRYSKIHLERGAELNSGFSISELEDVARTIRGQLVRLSHTGRSAHLGSALSCVDIAVAAYFGVMQTDRIKDGNVLRDRFLMSKGHAATTLYAVLHQRGIWQPDLIDQYNQDGGCLAEHPGPSCAPGIEAATGSLGHGLSIGLGMALAAKIQHRDYRVRVVVGDGECNEGAIWEAALTAPAWKVSNLMVIVDANCWQATGRSQEVTCLEPLVDKWKAFGWRATEVDGHDIKALIEQLSDLGQLDQPRALIARTTKGKGISFMEDDNNWHYRIPNEQELHRALAELSLTTDLPHKSHRKQ